MNKILMCLLACCFTAMAEAQIDLKITILHHDTKTPVAGATVSITSLKRLVVTDSNGIALFTNITPGQYQWEATHISFETQKGSVTVSNTSSTAEILMEPHEEEEEEVIIQSTRSSRTFRDLPTRVEFIAGEELDEKANMKPGDIRMVLTESTGIQTQQTSATSANASIRIQGLDGRYTQVLKDGLPLYAGFSNGLGLLQTPPLDLKQFEVIKGSASTLYGGGAIAGLVNLISKTPTEERELKLHLDATSAGGWNTSGFFGKKFGKLGLTLFASRNSNKAYDPSDVGLTAIPKFERYTVNPKLFVYFNEKTQLNIGANFTTEDRTGGDIAFIKKDKTTGFFENNDTRRLSTQFSFEHRFNQQGHLTIKNSFNRFDRVITTPTYTFDGLQNASFTEIVYGTNKDRCEWIGGVNFLTDKFQENKLTSVPLRDYEQLTVGAFIQNNWKIRDWFHLETGLRGDHVRDYGTVFLPRVSALFKFNPKLSSRVGGGLGYKTPTIFTEETERLLYQDVLPIDEDVNKLERSYGVNADINYKTKWADGEIDFSINHLFFYTRIDDPLLLQPGAVTYRLLNTDGHIDSKGMETNVRLGYHDFKLFLKSFTCKHGEMPWLHFTMIGSPGCIDQNFPDNRIINFFTSNQLIRKYGTSAAN